MNSKKKRLGKYLVALLVTVCAAVAAYWFLEVLDSNIATQQYAQGQAFGAKQSALVCVGQSFVAPPKACQDDAFCEVLYYSNFANGCLSAVHKRDEQDVVAFCKKGSKTFDEDICPASGAMSEVCTAVKVGVASVCARALQ